MKKLLAVMLVVLLVSPSLPVLAPAEEQETISEKTLAAEGSGPSVDLSHQVLPKCSWDSWDFSIYEPAGSTYFIAESLSFMLENDGMSCYLHHRHDSDVETLRGSINFRIHSSYDSLKECQYDIFWDIRPTGVTLEASDVQLRIYTESGCVEVDMSEGGTFTGTLSLSADYVVDSIIHGEFYWEISDTDTASLREIYFRVDELSFHFNSVSETVRSDFEVIGGTVKYTVSWTILDDNVNTTVTPPSGWTYQDVNPDADVTNNEFHCTWKGTYTATYTAPVLATANWRLHHSEDAEDGVYAAVLPNYLVDDITEEYTVVADGAASIHVKDASHGVWWLSRIAVLPDGYYWLVFGIYMVSGSVPRLYWYDGSWHYLQSGSTGRWTFNVVRIHVAGIADPGTTYERNWEFYHFGAAEYYIDCFALYNSSVSLGETITGTCRHIHPNGYVPAAYTEVQLGLWDSSHNWKEYQSVTTDADGDWSFDTDDFSTSLTAQTYHLWTWVYCDANGFWPCDDVTEATTDWSGGTVSTSTDAKEGTYSVQAEGDMAADKWFEFQYNPAGTWDITNYRLLTMWVKLNDTETATNERVIVADSSNDRYIYHLTSGYYELSSGVWFRFTVPLFDGYEQLEPAGDPDWTDITKVSVSLYTATAASYKWQIDSLNFLTAWTSDSLPVYQLGMTAAYVYNFNGVEGVLQVDGETYSDQLYNVSLDGVEVASRVQEGALIPRNNTVGTHTYTVTAVGRASDPDAAYLTASDTYQYTITPDSLAVEDWTHSESPTECWGYVKANKDATCYVYENDTLQLTVNLAAGGTSFNWPRDLTVGVIRVCFLVTDGSDTWYLNYTYYNVEVVFQFERDWELDDQYVHVWAYPNYDCTVYIYENDTLKTSGPAYTSGTSFSWLRSLDPGTVFVGVKAVYGSYVVWRNFTYYNERALAILAVDFHLSDLYCNLYVKLNMNTSYFVYERKTTESDLRLVAYGVHSSVGGIISWPREQDKGVDVLVHVLFMESAANYIWFNTSYSNAVPAKPEGDLGAVQVVVFAAPAWVVAGFILLGFWNLNMTGAVASLRRKLEAAEVRAQLEEEEAEQ